MDKSELLELFADLDRELETAVDIILIGGAAMILHYGALRTTSDIDVLFLRGDISEIRTAIKAVAENRHPQAGSTGQRDSAPIQAIPISSVSPSVSSGRYLFRLDRHSFSRKAGAGGIGINMEKHHGRS